MKAYHLGGRQGFSLILKEKNVFFVQEVICISCLSRNRIRAL